MSELTGRGGYGHPVEHLRDLLEPVRLRLLRFETVVSRMQEHIGAPRDHARRMAFLVENAEPHRVPLEPELREVLEDCEEEVAARLSETTETELPWEQLRMLFNLDALEELILLAVLAPRFSSGFRFAFEEAAGRSSWLDVDFVADLLALEGDTERWRYLEYLQPDQTLISTGLLKMRSDAGSSERPLVAVSPVVLDYVMNRPAAAVAQAHLAGFCRLEEEISSSLEELPLSDSQHGRVVRFLRELSRANLPGVISSAGISPLTLARGLAAARGQGLVTVHHLDIGRPSSPSHAYGQLGLFVRLYDLMVAVDLSRIEDPGQAVWRQTSQLLERCSGVQRLVLLSNAKFPELRSSVRMLQLGPLTPEQRAWVWEDKITQPGDEIDLPALAHSFSLNELEIEACVERAESQAPMSKNGKLTGQSLVQEARNSLSRGIELVADKIETHSTFDDLLVDASCREQLDEVLHFLEHLDGVRERFPGYARNHVGQGTLVFFHGPPGTGKTLAATVLARESGRELYRIDLSRVLDKYIGETEKQLEKVFSTAENTDSIILFDEADSLFSRRTAVRSASDGYANTRVNYLLQRVESYRGVCILTTNNMEAIDEAFRRRVPFQVLFEKPDEELRERLWKYFLERTGIPGADHVAAEYADLLAENYEFPGAHIRNAVMKAVVQMMTTSNELHYEMLLEACDREYASMGGLIRRPGHDVDTVL